MKRSMKRSRVFVVAMITAASVATVAHAGPPALSTNPGNLVIFPARGQSPEQQKADEATAYDWATKQTGWDPYQAKTLLDQQTQAATAAGAAARGGAVKGAAGGALAGVAIGAIAGDAGKGAAIGATSLGLTGGVRSRRATKAAGGTADEAAAARSELLLLLGADNDEDAEAAVDQSASGPNDVWIDTRIHPAHSIGMAKHFCAIAFPAVSASAPSFSSQTSSRIGSTGPGMVIWPGRTRLKPERP